MSKKKLKYKPSKGPIDSQDSAHQAIVALNIAGQLAAKNEDAKAMATVGLGWATLTQTVFAIEHSVSEGIEIAELQADTEIVVNKTGFSPNYQEDEEDDE